jgi:hypothetical protein
MGTPAENLIDTLDGLPDSEKHEVAAAILRRTAEITFPSLSDDELVLIANETFLELDRSEAVDVRGCL